MPYLIKGTDTSGTVTLRRDTVAAALKKAAELTDDGSWDIEIEMPDGRVVSADAFDALRAEHSEHSS